MTIKMTGTFGARSSYEALLLEQPHVQVDGLWKLGERYFIHCPKVDDPELMASDGTSLVGWFGGNHQMCSPVELVSAVPDGATRVPERSYEEILALTDDVRTLSDIQSDLCLLLPRTFPPFAVSEEANADRPQTLLIVTRRDLEPDERSVLAEAVTSLGLGGEYDVRTNEAVMEASETSDKIHKRPLILLPSRGTPANFTSHVRWVVEEDEDVWMANRGKIGRGLDPKAVTNSSFHRGVSRCLVDSSVFPVRNIRVYLPLYERVCLVMPLASHAEEVFSSLRADEADLVRLARSGRVQFLCPQSVERYPGPLLNRLAEEAPESLLFSRKLALVTAIDMQHRMPMLFPPLGASERREILEALHGAVTNADHPDLARLGRLYLDQMAGSWSSGERLLHRLGAMSLSYLGIGRIVAAVFKMVRGVDLMIELEAAAKPVQWAGALGATVFPVVTKGYSAQVATELCASTYSGVANQPVPVNFGDVETVMDGILGLDNDASIIELEEALTSVDIDRLRRIVAGLAETNLDPDHLRETIEQFNKRVREYDRNNERLAKLQVVGLLGAVAAPIVAGHAPIAPFMGLATWFLGQLLLGPKPPRAVEKVLDTLRAANSWTSADVVFVSRVKKATDT